jgi:rubrerythrin
MANVENYNWDKLDSYTKKAADTIFASFREADLDMYKHFLNSMYHYTLHSGERLEFAARVAETDELKAFYKELADDEESHYRLAQADLEEFGDKVDPENPPEPVQRFHEYWRSLAKQHSSAYLGVLYVAENIAKYVTGPVLDMFPKLQLTKAQTRWLRVHAEVDLEHGAEVQEMCARYMDNYEHVITDAAKKMSQFWIDIMNEGFYGKSAPRSS